MSVLRLLLDRSLHGTLLLCALAVTLRVEAASEDPRLEAQRATFEKAYQAVRQGRYSEARRYWPELEDYILYPYLRYEDLWRNVFRRDAEDIEAFLHANEGSVLADRLRVEWLRHLARAKSWQRFIDAYRPQNSVELRCQYLLARIRTGAAEGILQDAKQLWLAGKSQPDACDPAFEALYASELMNDGLLWQRVRLAMEAGRPSLASYLGRKFESEDSAYLLATWLTLYNNPAKLKADDLVEDTPLGRYIVAHILDRRARQNLDAAITLWGKLDDHFHFTPDERSAAIRRLALRAARKDHEAAIDLLDQVGPGHVDEAVEHARLKTALKTRAWPELARWTERAPVDPGASLQWRYWRARALEASGSEDVARAIYTELATERDYYGFLAADRIDAEYRITHIPVAASRTESDQLLARPGVARVAELYALGMTRTARREWYYELDRMSKREMEVAAALAHEWGWHDRAIMTLGRAKSYDDLELRFPILFRETVEEFAAKRELNPAVLFSIIRAESAFLHSARSPAGARGLMQLMPATGRETARRIGLRYTGVKQLESPRVNITLGSAYLKAMLSRYDGNFAMASAAYNAGPHRVRRWQMTDECTPADIWVELVPFAETRTYIRRTLFYSVIYQWRLEQQIDRLNERVTAIPAKRKSVTTC